MKDKPNFQDEILDDIEETAAEISTNAMNAVFEAFEGADIDLQARKIIWGDGESLTIEQSAKKISMEAGADIVAVTNHIICWLTMDFMPKGLNQEQKDSFEDQVDAWVND